jgi:hypothetical protein
MRGFCAAGIKQTMMSGHVQKNGSCETGETKTALEKVTRTPSPSQKNRTAVIRQKSGNICAVVRIGYMPAGSFFIMH